MYRVNGIYHASFAKDPYEAASDNAAHPSALDHERDMSTISPLFSFGFVPQASTDNGLNGLHACVPP